MTSMTAHFRRTTIVAACSLLSSAALAAGPATQPINVPDVAPATGPAMTYSLSLSGNASYAFDASLHDDNGRFSVFRTGGAGTVNYTLSPGNDLSATLDGEYNHYYFRDFAAIPGDDGADSLDVYQFDLRPTFTHQFTPDLSAYGGLIVTASGMAKAHVDDALSYGAFVGVTYKFSPTLTAGVGVGIETQLEDDPFAFPLLTLNWNITPDLTLSAQGTGVQLSYKLSQTWTVFGGARYDYRQFRFDGDEIVRDGVLTDESIPVTVGVTCHPLDGLSVTGEVGVIAYRRLEVDSSTGHQVNADEADPAVFAGIQVEYAF